MKSPSWHKLVAQTTGHSSVVAWLCSPFPDLTFKHPTSKNKDFCLHSCEIFKNMTLQGKAEIHFCKSHECSSRKGLLHPLPPNHESASACEKRGKRSLCHESCGIQMNSEQFPQEKRVCRIPVLYEWLWWQKTCSIHSDTIWKGLWQSHSTRASNLLRDLWFNPALHACTWGLSIKTRGLVPGSRSTVPNRLPSLADSWWVGGGGSWGRLGPNLVGPKCEYAVGEGVSQVPLWNTLLSLIWWDLVQSSATSFPLWWERGITSLLWHQFKNICNWLKWKKKKNYRRPKKLEGWWWSGDSTKAKRKARDLSKDEGEQRAWRQRRRESSGLSIRSGVIEFKRKIAYDVIVQKPGNLVPLEK